MKTIKKASYFLSGMLTAILLVSLITPALASGESKKIDVSTGISIYVNDSKLEPKDAQGNLVDVFSYNGTTYLPVRAICEAFNISVEWDGTTQSVYLGNHTSNTPIAQKPDSSSDSNKQTNETTTSNQSRTVYITPTGKRYHYNSHCNGGSYSATTLEAALKSGLTPCGKCVK